MIGTAAGLALLGYASWAAPSSDAAREPAQPMDVRIISAPESKNDSYLVVGTWLLVIANAGLCYFTWRGARKQSRDMRDSIAVAQQSAAAASASAEAARRSADAANKSAELAARQRREELEREANRAAHKVIATAGRVQQLAEAVPRASAQLFALSGMSAASAGQEARQRNLELRQKRTAEIMTDAGILLGTIRENPEDSALTAGLRKMDELLVQLELMREDVTDELRGIEDDSRFRRQENAERLRAAGGRTAPPFPSGAG